MNTLEIVLCLIIFVLCVLLWRVAKKAKQVHADGKMFVTRRPDGVLNYLLEVDDDDPQPLHAKDFVIFEVVKNAPVEEVRELYNDYDENLQKGV